MEGRVFWTVKVKSVSDQVGPSSTETLPSFHYMSQFTTDTCKSISTPPGCDAQAYSHLLIYTPGWREAK